MPSGGEPARRPPSPFLARDNTNLLPAAGGPGALPRKQGPRAPRAGPFTELGAARARRKASDQAVAKLATRVKFLRQEEAKATQQKAEQRGAEELPQALE